MRIVPFIDSNGKYQIEEGNLSAMPDNGGNGINVVEYIGGSSAEKEWNENPELARHIFLHTNHPCNF